MVVSCEPWEFWILRLVRGGGRWFIEDNSVPCEWNWMYQIVAYYPDVGAQVEGSHDGWFVCLTELERIEEWSVGP